MTRIFVGNLPTDIAEKDVENEFGAYGTVNKVEVKHKRDPLTNNIMSTFAFVTISITDSLLNQCRYTRVIFLYHFDNQPNCYVRFARVQK